MINYVELKNQIEKEYHNVLSMNMDPNRLCDLISIYIRKTIENTIMMGNYLDRDAVEDLIQDTLLTVLEKGIYQYKDQGKSFAGYCSMIARNKAIDYANRQRKEWISRISDTQVRDYEEDGQFEFYIYHHSDDKYESVEKYLLIKEHQLECLNALKKYILLFLNQKDKPYRILGNCFTILLFKLSNEATSELSSPSWAYEQMKEHSLQRNADHFLREIKKRIRLKELSWGIDFLEGMEEEEDGTLICDIIFGERFARKDLENWSLRFRNKIRLQLSEELLA